MDEYYYLENQIGQVKGIFHLLNEGYEQNSLIQNPIEEKQVEQKKEVVVKEGEDAVDNQEPPAEQEEKLKFDPKKFDWSISNGNPKSLTQIFHKTLKISDVNILSFQNLKIF